MRDGDLDETGKRLAADHETAKAAATGQERCPKCERPDLFGTVQWRGEWLCLWCLRDKLADSEAEIERLREEKGE